MVAQYQGREASQGYGRKLMLLILLPYGNILQMLNKLSKSE